MEWVPGSVPQGRRCGPECLRLTCTADSAGSSMLAAGKECLALLHGALRHSVGLLNFTACTGPALMYAQPHRADGAVQAPSRRHSARAVIAVYAELLSCHLSHMA